MCSESCKSHNSGSDSDRGSKGRTVGGVCVASASCPQHKEHNESTAKKKQTVLLHAMIAALATADIKELVIITMSTLAQVPFAFVTSVTTAACTSSLGSPDVTLSWM